jgi:acyl-CoA thioesterase FadM
VVLIVRFALAMLLSRFRRKIGPLDQSTLRFTVLPHDCDLNFHLNAGRYISFMDVARVELLGRMRLFRKVMAKGWRPINGGMIIRYRRSILPFERFTLRSRVIGWDEKWLYFEHVMERGGQVCCVGNARGLFREGTRSVVPQEILELFGLTGMTQPELPEYIQRWRHAEDAR